jgi:hypothetical protein
MMFLGVSIMANVTTYDAQAGISHSSAASGFDGGLDAFLAAGNYRKLAGSTSALVTYQSVSVPTHYIIVASVDGAVYVIQCNDLNSYLAFMCDYSGALPVYPQVFTLFDASATPALSTDETLKTVLSRLDAVEQAIAAQS